MTRRKDEIIKTIILHKEEHLWGMCDQYYYNT